MGRWAKDVTELVGHTPLVELKRITSGAGATVLAKLEMFSPGGSIKDRVALQMICEAETQGLLRPVVIITEPTSGNMGISLAWIATARGYQCILTMPDTISLERRLLLQRFGAKIILTPGSQGMRGAINKVIELRTTLPNAWFPQQFYNQSNPRSHREGTAAEIWEDTGGAVAWASLQEAHKEENRGKVIATIFPSAAERYLHTILFDDLRS